jgi:hypothetical protein
VSKGARWSEEDLQRHNERVGSRALPAPPARPPLTAEEILQPVGGNSYNAIDLSRLAPPDGTPFRTRYVIGIDPGVLTGLAVWDREKRALLRLETLDFWRAWEYIVDGYTVDAVEVVIEDPSGNRPVFDKEGVSIGERRKRERIAQNVGSNKREARLLLAGLLRRGYRVRAVTPTAAKWSSDRLAALTGWRGLSSAHSRDAARLVFGS